MEVNKVELEHVDVDVDVENNVSCSEYAEHNDLIIEEISRNYKLLHRHKILKPQINIGRDYHNDIILSDPHVCPSHISIELHNGQWKVIDNQTVNGTFIENANNKKQQADQHIINDGDILSLGKSQLRILFTDHQVEPTVAFSPFENFIDFMRHPLVLLISMVLFTLIAGFVFYLNTAKEVNFSQLLVPTIGMTLGFALWPAGVALVSHLSKNEARVMTQLGISFVFFNLLWLSDFLEGIAAFNSASGSITPLIVISLSVLLAFCLFWLNGYIGFQMPAKRRIIVAASMTGLLFGGSYIVQYSKKPEFNPTPRYNATIMMPDFLMVSSSSVDKFIEDSNKLFERTKQSALK